MMKCTFKCPQSQTLSDKCKKTGFFRRKSDSKTIQRYQCLYCKRTFSSATHSPLCGQNKRRYNSYIFRKINCGMSQRRLALELKLNRKTIVRKFRFMASYLANKPDIFLKEEVRHIQIDHMETFEHTKMKPISILVVVDKDARKILAKEACSSPSKGTLAKRSYKKYGKRKDERNEILRKVFRDLKENFPNIEQIESDESPFYPKLVKEFFPDVEYKTYKGRKACVTGQGELKQGGFDPLFCLNHTCAMIRANINRLFRRTWNTTKKVSELQIHLDLYAIYHNRYLT